MRKWWLLLGVYLALGLAAGAGWIAGDYARQHDGLESFPPGEGFLLGTDHLGRSVAARVVHGARIALEIGVLAAGIAVFLGAAFGLLAGWYRGWADACLIWLSGAITAIPGIVLILALGFVFGRGFHSVFLAIGLVTWVEVFRLSRAEVLRLRESDYVTAARAAGAGAGRLLLHHLLPNLLPLLLVQFTLRFVIAVKAEVVISFLGLGMAAEPSWGRMIARAQYDLPQGVWWPLTAATLAMAGLILAVHMLSDGLRDRLDPGVA